MMRRSLIAAILFAATTLVVVGVQAGPIEDCAEHIPWGAPTLSSDVPVDLVCHAGYLSALDGKAKQARWVAYELTSGHVLGCSPRTGLQFKVDALAPREHQARLKDYSKSGYDLGHLAPNQDFAWDPDEQRDTFSFANVSPQLPGLNRQGWERGEEIVRAWAYGRGDLQVYVGPVLASTDPTFGEDQVEIPSAFFKVVVDRQSGDALGFVMPQKAIPKGPLDKFITQVAEIEEQAGIKLPMPEGHREASAPWQYDLAEVSQAHRRVCK